MLLGFLKSTTLSVAGLTMLAGMAAFFPAPGLAQLPAFEEFAPPSATDGRSVSPDTAYILGGGDRLQIDIFALPDYSGEYQVPIDGVLYLPLIGAVSVGGLTVQQASDSIAQQYARFLKRPIITVRLLSPRPPNVIVAGEVSRPGSFTVELIGGAGDNPSVQYPTLTQAIKQAGGITLAADIGQIQLRRRVTGGGEQLYTVNLEELVRTGNPRLDITLRDGDAIFVPTATEVDLAGLRQLAKVDFAAESIKEINNQTGSSVSVVGEVERPGSYVVTGVVTQEGSPAGGSTSTPTLTAAIQQAGGIKPLANIRNIEIRRQTKAGPEQLIQVNLWELLRTGDISQDTVLQDGDTIIVPKADQISTAESTELATARFSPNTIQVSVVGEVKDPGTVPLPPNTPLNQAILTAGGFNDSRARRSSVQLIRLNPNGTVVNREIPIDLAQEISEESNPLLRDNDIIVVGRSNVASVSDTLSTALNPIGAILSVLRFLLPF